MAMSSTPSVTMFMGAPGSGKGTVIKEIVKEAESHGRTINVIAPDNVIESLPGYQQMRSEGKSDSEARSKFHPEGTALALQIFKQAVANPNGQDIIFDNTGGNLARYQDLISSAKQEGLAVKVALVYNDLPTCKQWANERASGPTAQSVPENIIEMMHSACAKNFEALSQENSWIIYAKGNSEPREGRVVAQSDVPGNTELLSQAKSELNIVS